MQESKLPAENLFQLIGSRIIEKNVSTSLPFISLIALLAFLFYRGFLSAIDGVDAPTVGKRSKWEPWFWVRVRFFHEAWPILHEGYQKAIFPFNTLHELIILIGQKFKDSRFRFVRNDANIIVISNKYIDEIRSLPENVVSPIQAHVDVRVP